jgi:hypothetical protein
MTKENVEDEKSSSERSEGIESKADARLKTGDLLSIVLQDECDLWSNHKSSRHNP